MVYNKTTDLVAAFFYISAARCPMAPPPRYILNPLYPPPLEHDVFEVLPPRDRNLRLEPPAIPAR
jgi:hypothetical protein